RAFDALEQKARLERRELDERRYRRIEIGRDVERGLHVALDSRSAKTKKPVSDSAETGFALIRWSGLPRSWSVRFAAPLDDLQGFRLRWDRPEDLGARHPLRWWASPPAGAVGTIAAKAVHGGEVCRRGGTAVKLGAAAARPPCRRGAASAARERRRRGPRRS